MGGRSAKGGDTQAEEQSGELSKVGVPGYRCQSGRMVPFLLRRNADEKDARGDCLGGCGCDGSVVISACVFLVMFCPYVFADLIAV